MEIEPRPALYETVEAMPEGPWRHNELLLEFAKCVMPAVIRADGHTIEEICGDDLCAADELVVNCFDIVESMMDEYYRRARYGNYTG